MLNIPVHRLIMSRTVTERARKLRAQYMLQAQGMRSRIEIRVNRIPTALRKAKMGDLLTKHSQAQKQAIAGPSRTEKVRSPHKNVIHEEHDIRASPSPRRGVKRMRYVPALAFV